MAAIKYAVTGEQNESFYAKKFELERQWRQRALDPEAILLALQTLIESKKLVLAQQEQSENLEFRDWINKILDRERQYHLAFFGREFDLTEFERKLRFCGRRKIKAWQSLGHEPHFLPDVSLMPGDEYPGWRIKPEQRFYQMLVKGKIFRNIDGQLNKVLRAGLDGISVLIDIRPKPAYDDGRQMYGKDNLLGKIIEQLRKERKIVQYDSGLQSSRFGVSADEWEEKIKPALAGKMALDINRLRLETVEESNIIPQLYPDSRKNDGSTNTSVWYEQYFVGCGHRFSSGSSGNGVLADVFCSSSDDHWGGRSFRPLAVL